MGLVTLCIWGDAAEGLFVPSSRADLSEPDMRVERDWAVWGPLGSKHY